MMKKTSYILIFSILILICSCSEVVPKSTQNEEAASSIAFEKDGKALFTANCASCHNLIKESTGPPILSAMHSRNEDWLFKHLTSKDFISDDSISKVYREQYDGSCPKFTSLSRVAVSALYHYSPGCRTIGE